MPAYLWLKDESGALIKKLVDVRDRKGSIEIIAFSQSLSIPVDGS